MASQRSSPLGDLLGALRGNAAHDLADLSVRSLAAVVELDGDESATVAQLLADQFFDPLDRLELVDGVAEGIKGVVQRNDDGLKAICHAVSVEPFRHSFKPALDRGSWAGLASNSGASSSDLKALVVHSHRTQSAGDTPQMKTGRTTRLSPRVPALTTGSI